MIIYYLYKKNTKEEQIVDKFINKTNGSELRDCDKDCYDLINGGVSGIRSRARNMVYNLLRKEITGVCISYESPYAMTITPTLSDMNRFENCM